ncbi:S41 family peptidase [Tenacibaculum maritimum]|uniref:S41 family peptidase n=1 Tax=Tenacibaculum maritimum TaxID=107401 RepID=UPI001E5A3A62|nr:S41 family peptidase [Tenacibaculum maritimum]MCD9585785.1 S41 family peptidase [Tenacibaculum maritimum]MCD9610591.1 S41 family peptidase [Tenacibaculum maritimum]MCD9621749.1 S41 family peptidase [Tenacibaculum maritimum]MCD9628033.1 S41 family peptidase [Tenacibaculum maritimum]MCD9630797.1 S41 family peptidase [Tenacibaculum maritimum]
MKKNKKHALILLAGILALSFSFQSKFFEIAKQIEIYNNLFKELNINYVNEINPAELTNKAIKNTLKGLDPYTNFFTEQDVENAKIRREGEYGGIGIAVFYDKNGITITEIYKNYVADKAGLKVGDIITKADGQILKGLEKNQLAMVLKGSPGKKVTIEVDRLGKALTFNLTLDKIIIDAVPFYEMIDTEIGYIILSRFSQKAAAEIKKAFISLKDQGMKKLILDLRNNPGGSLGESINIVNFFTPKGSNVVETKGKLKKASQIYKGHNEPLDLEIPIVVLINGRSASASEIVSGALQDYDRAVILGERSFGKGLVQRYFKLSYGTQLKATISKYYTPSGRCIQELDYENRNPKTGIVPKFSEGTVNSFTTKNGRTVYDGGGVTPDILINRSKQTEATKKLLKSQALFNFATVYTSKKNAINIDDYSFNNADFNAFKEYLKKVDTTFLSKQESLFKTAYNANKNTIISDDYEKIKLKLAKIKIASISKNKDFLVEQIQDEIIKRYHYKEGTYQYHLKHDNTIKQAINILKNKSKYNNILAK